jgi:hypothetical protein
MNNSKNIQKNLKSFWICLLGPEKLFDEENQRKQNLLMLSLECFIALLYRYTASLQRHWLGTCLILNLSDYKPV